MLRKSRLNSMYVDVSSITKTPGNCWQRICSEKKMSKRVFATTEQTDTASIKQKGLYKVPKHSCNVFPE